MHGIEDSIKTIGITLLFGLFIVISMNLYDIISIKSNVNELNIRSIQEVVDIGSIGINRINEETILNLNLKDIIINTFQNSLDINEPIDIGYKQLDDNVIQINMKQGNIMKSVKIKL